MISKSPCEFLPASPEELKKLGWDYIDILLLTGDVYIDHPSFGTAVIGRFLEHHGFRVAVCDALKDDDVQKIASFGKPRLFYGVSSGNVDSSLMKFTAFGKIRNDDPYLPESMATQRPDRALIKYCNLIKQIDKETPVLIGGIEASMRRFAHYDFTSGKLRRSILADSRADILVHGMGEFACLEYAERLSSGEKTEGIEGTMIFSSNAPENSEQLPAEEEALTSKEKFAEAFRITYLNRDKMISQKSGTRYLVSYPQKVFSQSDLDLVYSLPYSRKVHPKYGNEKIAAFEMIKFSINSHRGCVSGCSFCSIFMHQGKRIISRSGASCIAEAEKIASMNYFKGHITDLGGPSANMYGTDCSNGWKCARESCLYPARCKNLKTSHKKWFELMRKIDSVNKVKHLTVGSGIRYDLFINDNPELLDEFIEKRVSGQLKVAPEHTEEMTLRAMRKKPVCSFEKFADKYFASTKRLGIKRFIIPYLMSAHPGSTENDMKKMKDKIFRLLKFVPNQVQLFIPLPGTISSVTYYTGFDPLTGEKFFSEHDKNKKRRQHDIFFK